MPNLHRVSRVAVVLLTFAALSAWAQPAAPGRGGAAVRSPEVSADGKVTFRLRAPNAKEVAVTGIGQRLAMQKDEQGVWTATTEPLKPDMYAYSFSVDGATFTDPGNPLFKPAYGSAGQSMVHVPGDVIWEPSANVARGAITRHFYHSAVAGDDRDYWVYTPANYDPKRKEPYPVLYLLHGLGDEASGWIESGAANVILDNLIAQGKAKPMLMVNTLGYGTSGGTRGAMASDMIPSFTRTVLEEVMPQVEKAYNATKDRNQRAIAGLSMGGAEALYTGLNHLDRFAWVGSFSGAFIMWPRGNAAPAATPATPAAPGAAAGPGRGAAAAPGRGGAAGGRGGGQSMTPSDFERSFPKLDAKANPQIRLLWIACGLDDGLNTVNRQFKDWLKTKNVEFKDVEVPGFAHVWPLWRRNLAELAPLLFQAKAK